jgi:hypothetical protein
MYRVEKNKSLLSVLADTNYIVLYNLMITYSDNQYLSNTIFFKSKIIKVILKFSDVQ